MAKKRTGLQSDIAGIFSGVPVPKKGGQRSQPGGSAPTPDVPASKPDGSVIPKPMAPLPMAPLPVAPKPIAPVTPMPERPVGSLPATPRPKVVEIKVPEQITRQIPKKISRRRKDKAFASKTGASSSKQKTEIILFVLISAVLVIVLARPYLASRRNPATSQPGGKEDNGNSTRANIEIDWPELMVYSAGPRDPMELGSKKPPPPEDVLAVTTITAGLDEKTGVWNWIATVNTEMFSEGGTVQGWTIIKINPDSVEFEKDGKRRTEKVKGKAK